MRDSQLYQQILGLTEPWFVERVELNMDQSRVDVFVDHRSDAAWVCPKCEKAAGLYDHAEERVWRHLDSCQLKTFLHSRVPRTGCPQCGSRTSGRKTCRPMSLIGSPTIPAAFL